RNIPAGQNPTCPSGTFCKILSTRFPHRVPAASFPTELPPQVALSSSPIEFPYRVPRHALPAARPAHVNSPQKKSLRLYLTSAFSFVRTQKSQVTFLKVAATLCFVRAFSPMFPPDFPQFTFVKSLQLCVRKNFAPLKSRPPSASSRHSTGPDFPNTHRSMLNAQCPSQLTFRKSLRLYGSTTRLISNFKGSP
ncbi:MAG: hypothetical protein JWL81_2222, partial [Verrucomicrobiales bacterium]|nr:hypothetical protein [Verrucomicrobiales bacterium]